LQSGTAQVDWKANFPELIIMKSKGLIFGALLAVFGIVGAAQAADTITFNLQNSTGRTIYKNSTFTTCSPSGSSCTVSSSISNGSTGAVILQAVHGATVGPLLIARYYYTSSGVTKSCQLQARVDKDSLDPTKCATESLTYSFMRTDGTESSPNCGTVSLTATPNYTACIFGLSATMTN
jgi:hypothetical protein